jgi:predicted ATPase
MSCVESVQLLLDRAQAVRPDLDWSYDLLTNQQRILAQRLSVFAGGFRLDAVEAVGGGARPDEVLTPKGHIAAD